jgi:hypothetical protein
MRPVTEQDPPQTPPLTPEDSPPADAAAPLRPGDLVTIGTEQPLRMSAITGSRLGSDGPAAPKRQSAIAAYDAPLTFDWRNRPLGGPPRQR